MSLSVGKQVEMGIEEAGVVMLCQNETRKRVNQHLDHLVLTHHGQEGTYSKIHEVMWGMR